MKNKKRYMITVAVVVVVLAVMGTLFGELSIWGVGSWSLRYYATPEEAALKGAPETILQDFDLAAVQSSQVVPVDDYNAFYFASTGDDLLVLQMRTKNGKFRCLGSGAVYNDVDSIQGFSEEAALPYDQDQLLDESGFCKDMLNNVVAASVPEDLNASYTAEKIELGSQTVFFIFGIA